MASPNSEQQSEPPDGESQAAPRVALVTAGAVVVAIAAAIGVLFYRSGKDVTVTNPSPVASTKIVGPADVPIAPPGAPQPHTEGEDCSHDYIAMRWQQRNGRWVCAAPGLVSNDHRVGDDCSHEDIDARWVIGPGPAWACVPRGQGADVGAPTPPPAPRTGPQHPPGPPPPAPPPAAPEPEVAPPAQDSPPAPEPRFAPGPPAAPEPPRPAPEPPPPPLPFQLPFQLPVLPFPPPPPLR